MRTFRFCITASCSINLMPRSTHHVRILNRGSERSKGDNNINLLTEFAFANELASHDGHVIRIL